MSGSYDRPDGRRDAAPHANGHHFDPYDDVLTGPADGQQRAYPTTCRRRAPTMPPASRSSAQRRPQARRAQADDTAVVPPDSVTGRSLTLVISIMCFLACLTAGTVYMINKSAERLAEGHRQRGHGPDRAAANVRTPRRRCADVRRSSQASGHRARQRAGASTTSAELLEPWLGQIGCADGASRAAPHRDGDGPRNPPNIEAAARRLRKQFPSASLDDHRRWQQQIRTVTRSFALGGLAILLLVAAATTAIIVSATRSSMASNREIVEVLHFVGATDRFIAREFESHFLRLGVRAGLVGAVVRHGRLSSACPP